MSFGNGAGAQELAHIQYAVTDGLPSSVIYQCLQDRNGFMWFCTDQGVSRFDGRVFRNFYKEDGLPDNDILKMYLDSYGNVWFISLLGIPSVWYKGHIRKMEDCPGVYAITEDHLHGTIVLQCNNVLEKGHVYLGNYTSPNTPGHWRFTPSTCDMAREREGLGPPTLRASSASCNFLFNYVEPHIFSVGIQRAGGAVWRSLPLDIHCAYVPECARSFFTVMPDQRSFFFTTDTFYRVDSAGIHKGIPLSRLGVTIGSVNDVFCENDSTLWVCTTNRGLIRVDHFCNGPVTLRYYFPEAYCTSIRKDREGGYWLTTQNDGVYYIPDLDVRYLGGTVLGKDVKCIREVGKDSLVAGLSNGNFVLVTDKGAHLRSLLPLNVCNRNDRLLDVVCWKPGQYIMATDRGLMSVTAGGIGFVADSGHGVKGVYLLPDDSLLFAASDGLFKLWRQPPVNQRLWTSRCTCINGLGDRYYWGTLRGLYEHDEDGTHYLGDLLPPLGGVINHVDIAPDSTVWVSTQQGVILLRHGQAMAIGVAQGLLSNLCKNAAFSGDVAWISTDKGISRIQYAWVDNRLAFTVGNITEMDGLQSNNVSQTTLSGGLVWAATANGISLFPADYIPHPTQEPLVYINDLDTGAVTIDYKANKLVVDLSGISFRSGQKITYQYRLADLDSHWVHTDNHRLEFTALPYGRHTFEVRVSDRWGWTGSQVKRIVLNVVPPFWSTLWFTILVYLAVSVLTGFLIFAYFRWRHRDTVREFDMADLEMKALRAQMNPHFIFNCLSSIQYYILDADIRNANLYLHKLSTLIRKILQHSPDTYSTLSEELSVLGLYMEMEKLRLAGRLEYRIEVSKDIDPASVLLPTLFVQPFAENSIIHGIVPLQDRTGTVHIDFRRSGNYLLCTIADNGVGINTARRKAPKEGHTSMGLHNLTDRIRIINALRKEDVLLKIVDRSDTEAGGQGTVAEIFFPLYNQTYVYTNHYSGRRRAQPQGDVKPN
ncbi:two component regulator with propeller domain [Dinghuibacter silviterrae]|uniref:Two component regulator with propeller domain n=1 Tax=Dinghuibacter silviterrae TaxID=1539049 RepID=A0A4R8DVV3_9BACT|nr:two component regulator with propeller domain [Dinghuibacter silviterrae]